MNTRLLAGVTQVLTVIVIVVDIALVATGVITPRTAVMLWLAVEIPLLVVTVALFVVRVRMLARDRDLTTRSALVAAVSESPLYRFAEAEIRAYRSLWMLVRGKKDCPGDVAFTSSSGALTIPAAFAVATAIEIAVLHLLIPWPWLSVTLAILSIWGLAFVFGFVATDLVHPHYLTGSTLILRQSGRIVAEVPIDEHLTVTARRSPSPTAPSVDGSRLHLPNQDGTNVELVLAEPVAAEIASMILAWRHAGEVDAVDVYVDEPEELVAAVRDIKRTLASSES